MTNAKHWSPLGAVAPRDLGEARLALHYAAQPLAAAAYAVLPMQEDHSHTNLLWSEERNGFVGRPLPGGGRCFLDLAGLRTGLLTPEGRERAEIELAGKTLAEAFNALTAALRDAGVSVPAAGLGLPEYDLPASRFAQGEPFPAPSSPAFEELSRWFGNGAAALGAVAATRLEGTEVRGWPHHFDLAALLALDPEGDPEEARSLNVGLSPGDESYDEPYFYISPWPYPSPAALPKLEAGAHWHTEDFTAVVLTGSAVIAADGAARQAELVDRVLSSSVAACLELLA